MTYLKASCHVMFYDFQAKMCLENEEDIPGDVLGALVKERTSKKDCADHVSWCGVPRWERGSVLAISGSV